MLTINFDEVSSGKIKLNNWKYMSLKPGLIEGQDYVLVSEKVWYFNFDVEL